VQFRIGSITKTMTAVLVLQCRDEGLLDLDDELGRFVPASGYAAATLRQLLAHTSGMQSEPAGPWWERTPGRSFAELVAANDGSGRVLEPAQAYHYSNVGFALLGEVVARLRGRPWDALVAERVWAPLGMTRTSYLPQAPAATGLSVDHLRGTLMGEPATDTGAMAPAGQVWSTVRDLARFAGLLRSGHPEVLPDATIAEMATPQAPAATYGLGMLVTPIGAGTFVGHLGSMPGFQACLHVDRQTGAGVVALTNATTGFMGVELAGRLLGESSTPAATKPWVPTRFVPAWAEELLGWWFWGNSAHEVRWENDRLEFRDVARGVVAERFSEQDGVIRGVEGYHLAETLHVVRRPDGTVSHLECATFLYTRTPYDPSVPIPGGHPER
jgi:CubicO group peptidase (beta-lactamase class C family)